MKTIKSFSIGSTLMGEMITEDNTTVIVINISTIDSRFTLSLTWDEFILIATEIGLIVSMKIDPSKWRGVVSDT